MREGQRRVQSDTQVTNSSLKGKVWKTVREQSSRLSIHVCMHLFMYVCMYIYVCICIYVYACIYVCIYVCKSVCIHMVACARHAGWIVRSYFSIVITNANSKCLYRAPLLQ